MLLRSREINQEVGAWAYKAYTSFQQTVTNKAYPCHFAASSLKKDSLRFGFVGDIGSANDKLYQYVNEYLKVISTVSPDEEAYTLLVVFFNVTQRDIGDDEACKSKGFNLIQSLYDADAPHDSVDINSNKWSLCIQGVPVFILIGCPHYENRRSRNLGEYFTLVFQTRKGLDFATKNIDGSENSVRKSVRDRVMSYDKIPLSSYMVTHGEQGNSDWQQYFLFDNNNDEIIECPLEVNKRPK